MKKCLIPEYDGARTEQRREGIVFLYKYRSLAGQGRLYAERFLVHNEVYFGSPEYFNDPFDCRVRLSIGGTDNEHRENLNRLFIEKCPTMSEDVRRQEIERIIDKERRHRDTIVLDAMRKDLQRCVYQLGVFCLAKKPDHMLMWSHYANEHAGFCLEFRHETELTFPFFLDQVNFRQKSLKEKAKYTLFFVTEVVQLRTDGMEPSIIVERLADQGIGFEPLTIGETVEDIKQYFDGQKHDPRTPDVLLGAVPIQDDRIQSRTIRIGQHGQN